MNKLFTAKMIPYWNRPPQKVWTVNQRGVIYSVTKPYYDDNPPSKIFIKGRGWKKIHKKSTFNLISIKSIPNTYDKIFDLVQKYGSKITYKLMGFDENSLGDHYPIQEIIAFERYGKKYLDWLNSIAKFDYTFLDWMKKEYQVTHTSKSLNYDLWIYGNNCSFRTNPFLGFHLQILVMGIFIIDPSIDVIRWDNNLKKFHREHHPRMSGDFTKHCNLVDMWYDSMSMKDHISKISPEFAKKFNINLFHAQTI